MLSVQIIKLCTKYNIYKGTFIVNLWKKNVAPRQPTTEYLLYKYTKISLRTDKLICHNKNVLIPLIFMEQYLY